MWLEFPGTMVGDSEDMRALQPSTARKGTTSKVNPPPASPCSTSVWAEEDSIIVVVVAGGDDAITTGGLSIGGVSKLLKRSAASPSLRRGSSPLPRKRVTVPGVCMGIPILHLGTPSRLFGVHDDERSLANASDTDSEEGDRSMPLMRLDASTSATPPAAMVVGTGHWGMWWASIVGATQRMPEVGEITPDNMGR